MPDAGWVLVRSRSARDLLEYRVIRGLLRLVHAVRTHNTRETQ